MRQGRGMKKMVNRKRIKVKRSKGDTILSNYPLVEIKWYDIISDSSWITIKELKEMELPICTTKGHLLSQNKGITRIFGDYAEDDNGDIDELGMVTLIPNTVIINIKKIVDKTR